MSAAKQIQEVDRHLKEAAEIIESITTKEAEDYHPDARPTLVSGVLPGIRKLRDGLQELKRRATAKREAEQRGRG